jgi:hypothetical protein
MQSVPGPQYQFQNNLERNNIIPGMKNIQNVRP